MSPMEALFNLNIDGYLQGPLLLAALAGFGLVVGFLTGLFGVGGAFAVTPLLNVGFGIPYGLAIGSSLSFTVGTSCSGLRRHVRLGNFEPRSTIILAVGSVVGAVLGATLNRSCYLALGRQRYTLTMHGLFVVLLVLTAWLVGRKNTGRPAGPSPLQRLPLGPRMDLPAANLSAVSVPGLCILGVAVGITTGMMGIGGGVLFVPLLILALGLGPHQAVGTSLGVVVFGSMAGTIKYSLNGNVNLWIVMSLLVSSVVGVQIGAWLCQRLDAARLRRYLAILIVLVALAVATRLTHCLLAR